MHVKLLLRRLSDYKANVSQIFSKRLTCAVWIVEMQIAFTLLLSFIMSKYNLIQTKIIIIYIYIYIYICVCVCVCVCREWKWLISLYVSAAI